MTSAKPMASWDLAVRRFYGNASAFMAEPYLTLVNLRDDSVFHIKLDRYPVPNGFHYGVATGGAWGRVCDGRPNTTLVALR